MLRRLYQELPRELLFLVERVVAVVEVGDEVRTLVVCLVATLPTIVGHFFAKVYRLHIGMPQL
jgi:hypothetical protein